MEQPDSIPIPMSGPVDGTIRIPGSKSIANRAVLIASLAEGISRLDGMLYSDDTRYMMAAWKRLGSEFKDDGEYVEIKGCSGILRPCSNPIYVENAGTAARFLTAALTLGRGTYLLDGNERMRLRPIRDLIDALNALGADVRDVNRTGCPPVSISAGGLPGGEVNIPGEKSSQYISAVILAAPYADRRTTVNIVGSLVSRTYVELTISMMADFGVHCDWPTENCLVIEPNQKYSGRDYSIEGDASSASYFFGLAAVSKGRVKVRGLRSDSSQGDLGLLEILEEMGCRVHWDDNGVAVEGGPLKAVDVDMNTMSDVAPTLAVISLFAEGTTHIRNVANMRIKECDRIHAVATELRKLGAEVVESEDGLSITGMGRYSGTALDTWDDHRMAMSLSLAGLKIPGVEINDPQCVSKTFPDYFQAFLPMLKT